MIYQVLYISLDSNNQQLTCLLAEAGNQQQGYFFTDKFPTFTDNYSKLA